MPLQQAQTQGRRGTRPVAAAMMTTASPPSTNEIPFDYVAKFNLRGQRGHRVQDVLNISAEGAFVAVSIGYSFIPAKQQFQNVRAVETVARRVFDRGSSSSGETATNSPQFEEPANDLQASLLRCLQTWLCGIQFKYSIVDSGSGRELQNQPIHNIAGLGESNGNRPFRPFPKPMIFMPRSTIRIEIEEISEGDIYGYDDNELGRRVGAELYIVLHGYKMLGYGGALP